MARQRHRSLLPLVVLAVLAVPVPTAAIGWLGKLTVRQTFAVAADQALVFLAPFAALAVARVLRSRIALLFLAVSWACYYWLLYVLLAYWAFTGHRLDFSFAFDARKDIPTTVTRVLPLTAWSVLAILSTLFVSFAALTIGVSRFGLRLRHPGLAMTLSALAIAGNPAPVRPVLEGVSSAVARLRHGGPAESLRSALPVTPLRSPLPSFAVATPRPVFLLQLESGNALALNGEAVIDGQTYSGDFAPELRRIARSGVAFPQFWSNSIQTHRSVVNSLCGITNNIGAPLALTPEKLPSNCLPQQLQQNGYRNLFYKAFYDLDYQNTRALAKRIGFAEIHGPDIMPPQHIRLEWGFDDCEFYQAVFTHLRTAVTDPDRLFVYLATAAHHYPFLSRTRRAEARAFTSPKHFIEYYLNSALEQDACLPVFQREFDAFFGGRAHLFVFADHSVPVGIHNGTLGAEHAYNENFLIPLVYVPPSDLLDRFRVGEEPASIPSLTDLPATVAELLSGTSLPNSFVPLLERSPRTPVPPYEDCHVMVQPYGAHPKIAVVRFPHKFVYSVGAELVEYFDLRRGWLEQEPTNTGRISYETFFHQYLCDRFKQSGNW